MDIRFKNIEVCPICASGNLKFVMHGKDMDSLRLQYSIVQCPRCLVCITNPQPYPDDIWQLYSERSSPDFVPSSKGAAFLRQYFFRRYIDKILRNVTGDRLKVLDYGCGDGLLSLLLSQHPRCEYVTASDFHPVAPYYVSQLGGGVSYMPNNEFIKSDARYDLILCRQVLEHVHDPVACLGLFRRHMNDNAWIFVEVPNFQSVWRSIFGSNWSMLYLPRHLFHYSSSSLSGVLLRAGLVVEKLQLGHFPGMKTSIYHFFGRHSPSPGVLAVLLFPLQVVLDCICRRSSVIAAYARTPDKQGSPDPAVE